MLRVFRLFIAAWFITLRSRWVRGPLRPGWSFTLEWIVRYLRRDSDETLSWDLSALRADIHARPYPRSAVKKVTTRNDHLGGVPVRWFSPPDAADERAVLFLHGGSYFFGSAYSTHEELIARLALESGCAIAAVEYRLSPEHPFPAQLEDARAALGELVERGIRPEHVALAGDSAGGNLALELAIERRDAQLPRTAGLLLLSPWCDLRMPGASFVENDPFEYGTRTMLVAHRAAFAPNLDPADPRISPACADLHGLPRTLLVVGDCEILRDDIFAFSERLTRAGVETTLHVARDLPHNPAIFAAYHQSGRRALDAATEFLRQSLA